MTGVVASLRRRWNWKSAVVSSICRAGIFFAANLAAGPEAAVRAMTTEFLLRAVASGFYGAMTQAFLQVRPRALATAGAVVVVPGIAHVVEFLVHYAAGTPMLGVSIAGSVAFSVLTTLFNMHAMRRGALIVGKGGRPLTEDMRRMPALVASFAAAGVALVRGWTR